jgi:hypothetical protein
VLRLDRRDIPDCGEYMCESDTAAAGLRPAKNETHPKSKFPGGGVIRAGLLHEVVGKLTTGKFERLVDIRQPTADSVSTDQEPRRRPVGTSPGHSGRAPDPRGGISALRALRDRDSG